jgi:putative transposase
MSNYRRPFAPGATWFFTVVTEGRRPFLCEADTRAALRSALSSVRQMLPFRIEGWVLLPDHMHCIWTLPDGDAAIGKRWGLIKAQVTRQVAVEPQNPNKHRPTVATKVAFGSAVSGNTSFATSRVSVPISTTCISIP